MIHLAAHFGSRWIAHALVLLPLLSSRRLYLSWRGVLLSYPRKARLGSRMFGLRRAGPEDWAFEVRPDGRACCGELGDFYVLVLCVA